MRRRVLKAFERAERELNHQCRLELLTFVLVGGGPSRVELAGTLARTTRQRDVLLASCEEYLAWCADTNIDNHSEIKDRMRAAVVNAKTENQS